MKKRTSCMWSVLTILTLIEIFRAITEYTYYGRGLGFGLTVVMPLMVLLPLMIIYQINQISFHRQNERQRTKIYYVHIVLLSVFFISLVNVLLILFGRTSHAEFVTGILVSWL